MHVSAPTHPVARRCHAPRARPPRARTRLTTRRTGSPRRWSRCCSRWRSSATRCPSRSVGCASPARSWRSCWRWRCSGPHRRPPSAAPRALVDMRSSRAARWTARSSTSRPSRSSRSSAGSRSSSGRLRRARRGPLRLRRRSSCSSFMVANALNFALVACATAFGYGVPMRQMLRSFVMALPVGVRDRAPDRRRRVHLRRDGRGRGRPRGRRASSSSCTSCARASPPTSAARSSSSARVSSRRCRWACCPRSCRRCRCATP